MITFDGGSNIHESCPVVVSTQSCPEIQSEQREKWTLLARDIALTDEKFFQNT